MVTTDPNDVVKEFHDRMPVILAKADFEKWLDPNSDEELLLSLLTPWIGKLTVTETPKAAKPKEEAESEAAPKKKTASKPKAKGKDLFE